MKWLNNNTEEVFYIKIGKLLNTIGVSPSNITSAEYLVKDSKADKDEDALVVLTLGDGISIVEGSSILNTNFVMQFRPQDFSTTSMLTGKVYSVGLRFKTATMENYFEVTLQDNILMITKSFFN